MLAQLLRRLLAAQLLLGAGLGWLLSSLSPLGDGLVLLLALWAPLAIALVLTVSYALKSRTPGSAALWWRSVAGEYRACCRVYLLQMPWAKKPALRLPLSPSAAAAAAPALGLPVGIPVLLVHGYLCNHRVWDTLAQTLHQAGHPVLAVDLEPLFTSIDDYAPLIEQAVSALCHQTGAEKVALVGHSMGGLVIRAWVRACGAARVARIVTLGTPHQGTRIDLTPQTPNGLQMAWHSDWLKALAQSETPAIRALMRLALTPQDSIVYPQREQTLDGAPLAVFEGLGHLELCQNRAVGDWVLAQLRTLQG